MSEVSRDIPQRIAEATARGDVAALAALAIELATRAASAEGKLSELERAEEKRKRGAADRQRRRREKPEKQLEPALERAEEPESHVTSRDVTQPHATARDVTQRDVTERDVTAPPSPVGFPQTPILTPTHATHTHPRERTPTPETGRTAWAALRERIGVEGIEVVEAYLLAIGTRNRDGWAVELLRIVGPATGIEPEDLVQGLRDAMLVEPIVKQPGPLTTFVQFRKRQRQEELDRLNRVHVAGIAGTGSGRKSGKTVSREESEASHAFGRIRALIEERNVIGQGTRRVLPLSGVQELGERVVAAYTNVGGAERFLGAPADKLGILLAQFTAAYLAAGDPQPERKEA